MEVGTSFESKMNVTRLIKKTSTDVLLSSPNNDGMANFKLMTQSCINRNVMVHGVM